MQLGPAQQEARAEAAMPMAGPRDDRDVGRLGFAVLLLIVAAGVAAYANSFSVPFLLDDVLSIVNNPDVHGVWPVWKFTSFSQESTVSGRPLLGLSFALNYAIGGLNVWGYHAVNLTIHLLCAMILFGLVRRTLQAFNGNHPGQKPPDFAAAVVALIFTLHPLQTESVTYIVQRAELLVSFFYLMTVYAGIRALSSPHARQWSLAAVIACLLGMASKEVMVTAPCMVLA